MGSAWIQMNYIDISDDWLVIKSERDTMTKAFDIKIEAEDNYFKAYIHVSPRKPMCPP